MEQVRIYKYKLDFYYRSLIVYMMFLIVYAVMVGLLFSKQYSDLYKDPIVIISCLFILYYIIVLLTNMMRAKEMIFNDNKIMIKNRFGHREILYSDILLIRFSRERKHRYGERSESRRGKLKLKSRKRYLRIRISEFWDEKKLFNEFKNLSKEINLHPGEQQQN